MEKKKYRSIYFKDETLWVEVEEMASDEERSVNAMVEILVKRAIEQNKILKRLEKHRLSRKQTK